MELEVYLPLQVYGFTGIPETWWDSPHDRIIAMDEYRLFEGEARKMMVRSLFKPLLRESGGKEWKSALPDGQRVGRETVESL